MELSLSEIHKLTLQKNYLSKTEVKHIIDDQVKRYYDVRLLNELLFHLSLEELLGFLGGFSYYNPVNNYEIKSPTQLSAKIPETPKLELGLLGTNVIHFVIPYILLSRLFEIKVVWVRDTSVGLPFKIVNRVITTLLGGSTVERDELASEKMNNMKDHVIFHKLNFIIPKSVIEFFPKGIINDHWGTLPYYRGRSTFEYQSLFNHKKMFTNHLIAEGIDSGGIISYTACGRIIWWSKYFMLYRRIKLSALMLYFENDALLENEICQGATFYKMHKDLGRLLSNAAQTDE